MAINVRVLASTKIADNTPKDEGETAARTGVDDTEVEKANTSQHGEELREVTADYSDSIPRVEPESHSQGSADIVESEPEEDVERTEPTGVEDAEMKEAETNGADRQGTEKHGPGIKGGETNEDEMRDGVSASADVRQARTEEDQTGGEEGEQSDDSTDGYTSSSDDDSSEDSDDEALSTSSYSREKAPETTADTSRQHVSAIEGTQLSPDGTCIFTTDYARRFTVYAIDTDILETKTPRQLHPYAQLPASDPIWAFAVNPYFSSQHGETTQVLISRAYQYISLYNVLWDISGRSYASDGSTPGPLDISTKLATYKLIKTENDTITAPNSLTYTTHGTHFIAGSKNQLSTFDLNYTDGPVTTVRTNPPTRSKLKFGGSGFKGSISSLALAPSTRILAAGTRNRNVGLYSAEGSGEQTAHISLPGTVAGVKFRFDNVTGSGVSQLKWSPCENYLYIAERESDALYIYDMRNFSMCLGYCIGRNALTRQKLGFDVWPVDGGHEIWAGGVDGKIRVWRDPHLKEGAVEADDVIALGNAPVSNTLVHPCGGLIVAASASREVVDWEGEGNGEGMLRGGGLRPRFREWGRLDILGL